MSERRLMAAVAIGAALVPLNSTMIVVALPELIEDFGASLSATTWLVTSYLATMAVLQPLSGRLGDRVGRRPLVLGGLAWFAAASAAAALAPSLELLVVFRVQQAVAGALIFPNGMAVLREAIPAERLGGRMGTVAAALPLAAAAGPPIAGGLIAVFGWRAIFVVSIPIVLAAMALASQAFPESEPSRPPRARGDHAERSLARSPRFLAATGAIALSNMALYVTLLALPVLLARRGGWSPAEIGLMLATISAGAFLLSPLGGALSDRVGRRLPAVAGSVLLVAGLAPLAIAPDTIGSVGLGATLALAGIGVGLATPALQTSALEQVPVSAAGAASGVVSTSRYIGSITGALLLGGPLAPHGLDGFGLLFVVLAGSAAAAAALSAALPGARPRRLAAA